MAFPSLRVASLLCAGLFLFIATTAGFAQEGRCAQLVALEMQYRGVALTLAQRR